jgi:superfamily II DNA or RNA helicase
MVLFSGSAPSVVRLSVNTTKTLVSYFSDHYADFRWPIADGRADGLRLPQWGSLHAIAAHFSTKTEPAIVTMPTGSGKTAVLMGAGFVLRAERVLVITPSRIVREQIAEEFKLLRVLKKLGVVAENLPNPAVHSIAHTVQESEWGGLSRFDTILTLPNSISPAIGATSAPPADFFDLVLIDEAHHAPAPIWSALLERVSSARQVQFTATPFRRDRKEIFGRLTYTYQLRDAYRDGVFGQLEYRAVTPAPGEDPDVAIASAAVAQLAADRREGLDHRIMVRTGTKIRARELLEMYRDRFKLKINLLTGDHTLGHLRRTVDELRAGQLDGIVCVDMLGEGFDLPILKIAALHSPHKSLAITLQFIGRFARTTGNNLGSATFFALASDMEVEKVKLYNDGAVWEEIIPNLSGRRVQEEEIARETLATFTSGEHDEGAPVDLSLYSLRPSHHAKVYHVGPDIDITRPIEMPPGTEIAHRFISAEHSAAIFVVRVDSRPEWSTTDDFDTTEYHLLVNYHDRESGLLFICSSLKGDAIYEHIGLEYLAGTQDGRLRPPSLKRLNKVLLDLENARFFNIGMRKSVMGDNSEAYRIIAGSNASEAIDPSLGRTFRRGHYYGTADSDGERVTVGVSSSAKLWSSQKTRIPELLEWCKLLARKIASDREPRTLSGLDLLSTGEELTQIPEHVAFMDWHQDVFQQSVNIRYSNRTGQLITMPLLDLDLRIDFDHTDARRVAFLISDSNLRYAAQFSLETDRYIHASDENDTDVILEEQAMTLEDYLNHFPPTFFTLDLASFQEASFFPPPAVDAQPFDLGKFEVVDWNGAGVDIGHEYGEVTARGISIHQYLRNRLVTSPASIVYYDHGPGEIADFLAFSESEEERRISLYHCKGSSRDNAGRRLDDAYEVVGQAIKCIHWCKPQALLASATRRLNRRNPSRLEKGNIEALRAFLNHSKRKRIIFESVIVQPGFSREDLDERIGALLAAADGFLYESPGPFARLRVIGSG